MNILMYEEMHVSYELKFFWKILKSISLSLMNSVRFYFCSKI